MKIKELLERAKKELQEEKERETIDILKIKMIHLDKITEDYNESKEKFEKFLEKDMDETIHPHDVLACTCGDCFKRRRMNNE